MGGWKARVSMHPVCNGAAGEFQYDSDRFQSFLEDTEFAQNTEQSNEWFEEHRPNMATSQAEYWLVWQQKSQAEQAERTLQPNDGV
jgi:hypothetical protein